MAGQVVEVVCHGPPDIIVRVAVQGIKDGNRCFRPLDQSRNPDRPGKVRAGSFAGQAAHVLVAVGSPGQDNGQCPVKVGRQQPPDGKLAGEPRGQFGKQPEAVLKVAGVAGIQGQRHSGFRDGPKGPSREVTVPQGAAEDARRRRIFRRAGCGSEVGKERPAHVIGAFAEAKIRKRCAGVSSTRPRDVGGGVRQHADQRANSGLVNQFVQSGYRHGRPARAGRAAARMAAGPGVPARHKPKSRNRDNLQRRHIFHNC